ncbi:5-hydroxytryptamine receptor 1D-like [Pararge aegeria]|uniref:5-hydroxytryptamine receptor 1D-like n=1 Tax=Pararge aegeria TaxID=116150 RepID=UPI0019CFD6E7|nr:5-hydroxytryptamine receptor 1D-like [Pararge aegeria]
MVMLAITCATVFANFAVMLALWRVRRAPSHYPLMSLVAADFLVGMAVLPIAALRELFVFNLNRVICACWSTLDVLCCTASILSLCALGWERYSGITAPLARAQRARRARTLSILVWPVSALVALPDAFIPSPKSFHPGELEKACDVNTNIWYVFFSITFSFYVPACMIVMQYGFILRALSSPPPIRAHRGRTVSPRCQKMDSTQMNTTPKQKSSNVHIQIDNNQNDVTSKACRINSPSVIRACTEPSTGKCSYKSRELLLIIKKRNFKYLGHVLRHELYQRHHHLDAAAYSALAHLSANGQHNAQLQAVMTHAAALGQVQGAQHPAITNLMSGLYGSWGMGDTFPTPSPESPDHWSTPSPQTPLTQSPHSDWSDRAALSPNDIQQTNKGATDAFYI